jgi:hypothetical protein
MIASFLPNDKSSPLKKVFFVIASTERYLYQGGNAKYAAEYRAEPIWLIQVWESAANGA